MTRHIGPPPPPPPDTNMSSWTDKDEKRNRRETIWLVSIFLFISIGIITAAYLGVR